MVDDDFNIPFQVTHLVNNMMNSEERPHIRDNFRRRLIAIRDALDVKIREYDNEMSMGKNYHTNRKVNRK